MRYWLIGERSADPRAAGRRSTTAGGARWPTPTWATPGGRWRSSTRAGSTPTREQFGRDIDRYSLMAADGWLVLRFAARHVSGPDVVLDRTAARAAQPWLAPRPALIIGSWLPPTRRRAGRAASAR